jgi:hypothetical protein
MVVVDVLQEKVKIVLVVVQEEMQNKLLQVLVEIKNPVVVLMDLLSLQNLVQVTHGQKSLATIQTKLQVLRTVLE